MFHICWKLFVCGKSLPFKPCRLCYSNLVLGIPKEVAAQGNAEPYEIATLPQE